LPGEILGKPVKGRSHGFALVLEAIGSAFLKKKDI
jgi:hypothetical protein